MITVAEARYQILHRLSRNSDDSDILEAHVDNWLTSAMNSQWYYYMKEENEIPAGAIFPPFKERGAVSRDPVGCRMLLVELHYTPLNLEDDQGIISVRRGMRGKPVQRLGSYGESELLRQIQVSHRQRPEEGWTRVDNTLYIYGNFPDRSEFGITLIPGRIEELSDEDKFPVPDAILDRVLEEAEKIGRRMQPELMDLENDGKFRDL